MNLGYGEKIEALRAKLQTFMTEHIYPNDKVWLAHTVSEQRWQPVPVIEELKLKARAARLVEFLAAEIARQRAVQYRIRPAVQGHGAGTLGTGSVQLLRSRHRQYGNAATLRYNAANRDVVSGDFGLAHAYGPHIAFCRWPDEVHRDQIARMELGWQLATLDRSDEAGSGRMMVR